MTANNPVNNCLLLFLAALLGSLLVPPTQLPAQTFHEDFSIWPVDLKINGTVMACSNADITSTFVDIFDEAIGGEKRKVVAIHLEQGLEIGAFEKWLRANDGIITYGANLALPSDPNSSQFEALGKSIKLADGVLLLSGRELTDVAEENLLLLKNQLTEVVANGGVVCGVGTVATLFGKIRHLSIPEWSSFSQGLNLIPDSVVYTLIPRNRPPEPEQRDFI